MPLVTRPDQIAELTRGIRLPLPSISEPLMNVISGALLDAWQDLTGEHGATLRDKDEAEVTALLQARLNASRDNNLKLSQIVACVVRGGETLSFDGTHIEKRPDLAVYLTTRNANFPLLIECKIIDPTRGKKVDLYCSNGIRRFVHGEYGWASTQAIMVAYVHDGSSAETVLTPYLQASIAANDLFHTRSLPERDSRRHRPIAVSKHGRPFRYVGGGDNDEPGPIAISHVWVAVPAR